MMKLEELEQVMQVYLKIKDDQATTTEINDAYFLINKDPASEEERKQYIYDWIGLRYNDVYTATVKTQFDINKIMKRRKI